MRDGTRRRSADAYDGYAGFEKLYGPARTKPARSLKSPAGWRPGSQITPWLRDNVERLTKLNREEQFSWAAAAAALRSGCVPHRQPLGTATNLAKAQEDMAFAAEWEAMPREEQDELLDLWRRTDQLFGTAAARFLSRSGYRRVLRGGPKPP
jgi:hypothetical protein